MARGKKYRESVASFDKTAHYDTAEALDLVTKPQRQSLMRL